MSRRPLVVLGLDSGAPERLLERGRSGDLPVLGSLLERGCQARLAGPEIFGPHGSWLTIFSGKTPAEHGVYARSILVPGTYETRRFDVVDSAVQPFWARLRGTGQRVAIVDAPETPLVEGLEGFQLSGWGEHQPKGRPHSEPSDFVTEVRRRYGRSIRSSEGQRGRWWDRFVLRRLLQRVRRKGALIHDLVVEREPFDLIVAVFGASHAAAHRFATWEGRDQRIAELALGVETAIDEEIGRILGAVGKRADVAILTNVGIRDGYPTDALTRGFCEQLGYQQGPVESGESTVFCLPSKYTGFLRVNLRDREPRGKVERGSEYELLLDKVEEDLRALRWEGTREPAVDSILRTATELGDGPPDLIPDIVVEWGSTERASRAFHPRATIGRPHRGSPRGNHHTKTGLVILAGDGFEERGDLGSIRAVTLAERFLHLLT